MSFERFFNWYKKYKRFQGNLVVVEIYEYLSRPESIYNMLLASDSGKPALMGVVRDFEEKFEHKINLSDKVIKHLVGSMVKEVIYDFGYMQRAQRTMPTSKYFTSATYYEKEEQQVKKKVIPEIRIVDVNQ